MVVRFDGTRRSYQERVLERAYQRERARALAEERGERLRSALCKGGCGNRPLEGKFYCATCPNPRRKR